MLPPKNSIYRSWNNLCDFMGADQVKQMGSRTSLCKQAGEIFLMHQKQALLIFKEDRILILHPNYRTRPIFMGLVNPILTGYGWYYGEITFGPHRKHWRGLKSTRVSPGTPESDYRSIAPLVFRQSPFMYSLGWDGKILAHGGKLTEYQVKRQMQSFAIRSEAGKKVREFAYILGFPNTAKMNGFKLPKDKSLENANKLNELARQYGYQHVAHAWANGFVLPTDPQEVEMLSAGVIHLVKDSNSTDEGKKSYPLINVYTPSQKLWLRQRLLDGEVPLDW